MRLTALLLIIGCLHVSARSYSQNVSFSGENVPLITVLASIEKQAGISFFFNTALVKDRRLVTVHIKNEPLENALHEVLMDQGLDFYQEGKTIFIIKKEPSTRSTGALLHASPNPSQINLEGKVINEKGEGLVGASIMVKNGKKGTVTDEKGIFHLKGVSPNAILLVSFAGYQLKEIEVNSEPNVVVQLKIATNAFDEVQVIAYGNTTQRMTTGNTTTVKGSDIAKQPIDNPLLALEGRVPGLFITQSTGFSGTGVTVRVQGQNSINSGNDPLYVIDGVPYTSQLLPTISNVLGSSGGSTLNGVAAGSGNPLSFLNPSDIESISVLKDADATAIYGSRAANGAVLITTKKGKIGESKVDLMARQGVGEVGHLLPLMNNPEYLEMRHEALRNDGIPGPAPTDYDINGFWDSTRATNWQKTLIGGDAQYTDINAAVSGGNSLTQYLVNATYHHQTTVFPGDLGDRKGSVHFNINSTSNNQKFRLQLSASYLIDNNLLIANDLTYNAITLAPDAPPLYADGTLNWMQTPAGISSWINPLSYLSQKYQLKSNNLISNAVLSYEIVPGLEIKSNFGYTNLQSNEIVTTPLVFNAPENRPSSIRYSIFSNNNINSWIVEPQLHYKAIFGKGTIDALLGSSIQQTNSAGSQTTGEGFNSDLVLENLQAASTVIVFSSTISTYKYNAGFGRFGFTWDDKYLLDLTVRRDGSSRFGSANAFQNFGAVGAGWVFTKESFIGNNLPLLSFGKIRGSYGLTGNDQIGDYGYLDLYNPVNAGVAYQGATGLLPASLPNPYIQWEKTRKLQLGLDLGFLRDKFLLTVNYYDNHSSNELLQYTLPIITGFTSVASNFPATVQNYGWEIAFTTKNIETARFSWTSSINLTIPRNKLVAFPNLANSTYANLLVVGKPITLFRGFHFLGVNDTTGQYQFATAKGGPTYDPDYTKDIIANINTAPTLYGGFENTFRYKTFELSVLIQYVRQNAHNYYFGNVVGSYFNVNEPTTLLKRWQKPGDKTNIQRYSSDFSLIGESAAAQNSDVYFANASYARVKNVSLSWQLPVALRKRARLQTFRLFVQAQNLFTITHYFGLDPESASSTTLPPLRIVTGGVQITL